MLELENTIASLLAAQAKEMKTQAHVMKTGLSIFIIGFITMFTIVLTALFGPIRERKGF